MVDFFVKEVCSNAKDEEKSKLIDYTVTYFNITQSIWYDREASFYSQRDWCFSKRQTLI